MSGGNLLWTKGSPPHPLPKNFFQVGPQVPVAGRRGEDTVPWTGTTTRGRHFAFLFLSLMRMAYRTLRAQRTFEQMSGTKQKRGGQSAFRVLCHECSPLCQRAVLVLAFFAGGPATWAVRRRTGESIPLRKARWEDGGLGEGGTFAREPATEGGRRPCPLRRRELRASAAGQGPSFPPEKLLYIWKKRKGGTPGIMRASASLR